MRTIAAISLLAASAAAIAALPVQAQGLGTAQRPQVQRVAANTACARSFADVRCAEYQRRMIAAEATATSRKPVSVEEAGKRQLDALLRTIG